MEGRGKKPSTSDSVFKSILDSNHLDIVMSPALWLTNVHKLNSPLQLTCRWCRCESIVEILGCQSAQSLILCIRTEKISHHYSYHWAWGSEEGVKEGSGVEGQEC